ncbi:FAD/FMN-containing protein [Zopfia rhizophila CBS 207.26]|uniref:FAD/FMN-containing protein n=1 Tax=Zopfia rhizophila CBS 207.26 TaxID=1314779 RepID=A0A6A6E488_9PEZI|nr:FAD/FMN-containing protein [Zopfia rhizophila CBS 207.26]
MKFNRISHLLPLFFGTSFARDRHHCLLSDPCWPSLSDWKTFNQSISGRLVASRPAAAVCHRENYNEALCATARSNWTSSDWRTAQPGAYSAILWELGPDQCFINTTIDAPCQQGLVASYSVRAESIEDIQASVKFAAKRNLYLVVKNTGHDHLGRSSGKGSFSIWTHNLKGREWHDEFVPKGAKGDVKGLKAVTLRAGEQWLDVYRDADTQKRIVVGGSARTVGAAGGWFTGGGHSPFSHFHGLGADNVLEVSIVTASGDTKTLNAYNDPEHFWAIRGGAGNSWGIITSITYKTHPNPTHISTVIAQFTTNSSTAQRQLLSGIFKVIPGITDAGYTGYATLGAPIGLVFSQANGTNATANEVVKTLNGIGNITGVETQAGAIEFGSWMEYSASFLHDPNIATNVIDPSRLVTAEVLTKKTEELLKIIEDFPDLHAGFNFIGKVDNRERDNTAVHSIWKHSRGVFSMNTDWKDDAPKEGIRHKKLRAVEVSKALAKIVGEGGGTYVNEANPYEPFWKEAFWGEKYERLERIKKRVDPEGVFMCNRCVGGEVVYEP